MAKSKDRIFHSENLSLFLSELLGTALLVFLGCSSCLTWSSSGPVELHVVLSFGIAVLICVQIFGCVSGAHINPAVTVAALVYKLISIPVSLWRSMKFTSVQKSKLQKQFQPSVI